MKKNPRTNFKANARQLERNKKDATEMEGVAAEIRAGAEALESARSAVFVARAAVESEEAKQAGADAGGAE